MGDLTREQIEELAKRLNAFADGDVHEARRDALHGQHPEQNDYEIWAGLMTQASSALHQLLTATEWKPIDAITDKDQVVLMTDGERRWMASLDSHEKYADLRGWLGDDTGDAIGWQPLPPLPPSPVTEGE